MRRWSPGRQDGGPAVAAAADTGTSGGGGNGGVMAGIGVDRVYERRLAAPNAVRIDLVRALEDAGALQRGSAEAVAP